MISGVGFGFEDFSGDGFRLEGFSGVVSTESVVEEDVVGGLSGDLGSV